MVNLGRGLVIGLSLMYVCKHRVRLKVTQWLMVGSLAASKGFTGHAPEVQLVHS
jgi:hypothetical protein